jgi:hypothetical protein
VAVSLLASRRRAGWARRRGLWVALAVAAVLAVAVIIDLPTGASASYRRQALSAYVAADDAYIAQCRAGTHDALVAYVRSTATVPTVSRSLAETFVIQGISVCSFADSGVVNLGSAFPDRVIASPVVDQIAPALDTWAYLDAFDLLQELKVALAHPADVAVRVEVARDVAAADVQRQRIESLVESAERQMGATAAPLPLVALSPLMGSGATQGAP